MTKRATGRTTALLQEAVQKLQEGSDRIAFFMVLNHAQVNYFVALAGRLGLIKSYDRSAQAMTLPDGRMLALRTIGGDLDWLRGIKEAVTVDHSVWEKAPFQYVDELRSRIG